jgi:hypothetical protein
MKSVILECVLVLMAFAVLEETALARNYLNCVTKKVTIVDAPKGATSSSIEENFVFWIDEATKIVTLADGKNLDVRRFDDRWISAVSGDVSYEAGSPKRQSDLRRFNDERQHCDDNNWSRSMYTRDSSGAIGCLTRDAGVPRWCARLRPPRHHATLRATPPRCSQFFFSTSF